MPTKAFDMRITLGNLITLLSMAAGGVWVLIEMKSNDAVANTRLAQIEKSISRADADHDLLVEIRADLKMLRATVEKLKP